MYLAIFSGFFGALGVYLIGRFRFDLGLLEALRAVLASNIAGFIALLFAQNSKTVKFLRLKVFRHSLFTWTLFLGLYVLLMVLMFPVLLQPLVFFYLIGPLVLCTGFCMIPYGPVQDWILKRRKDK